MLDILIKVRFLWAAVFALSLGSELGLASDSLFEFSSHCVAYKTKKKILMIHRVNVIGYNCQVSTQIVPEIDEKYHFEMQVQARGFESGESERDRDVQKILKAESFPQISFKTSGRSKPEWQALLDKKIFLLEGNLEIGGSSFPVAANVTVDSINKIQIANGSVTRKFTELGISPPKLGMGILASVADKVELHFQIRADKTLGIDSISN
ncbi:MAG: YceI family protein [Bdellovibrionales bacterium]|nr:YceI family protein [Bdellovibrionales bacterium]